MNRSLAYAAATITLGLTACTAAAPAGVPTTTSPTPATAPATPSTTTPAPPTTPAPTTTRPPTTTAAPSTTLDPMIEFQAVLDRYEAARDVCSANPESCDLSDVVQAETPADRWHDGIVDWMLEDGWYAMPAPGGSATVEKILQITESRVSLVYCSVATEVDMQTHGTPDRSDDTPFSSGASSYRIELYINRVDDTWLVSDRALLGEWFGAWQCDA